MQNIAITFKKPCIYMGLEQIGFPRLGAVHMLPGMDIKQKLYNWTAQNWVYNKVIIKLLVELVTERQDETFYVSSKIARAALQGILEFADKEKETIKHLEQVFEGHKTVAGTDTPEFKNTLGNLSFAERQELLKKHNQRREDITENPL